MSSYGGLYIGGFATYIYNYYSRLPLNKYMLSIVDNFIHVPFCYLPSFYLYTGLMLGNDIRTIKNQMSIEYLKTLQYCWIFWIPVQTLNFSFIPLKYQVLFMTSCNLLWNVYISSLVDIKYE